MLGATLELDVLACPYWQAWREIRAIEGGPVKSWICNLDTVYK